MTVVLSASKLRADLAARLDALPEAMRSRPQWLLWKLTPPKTPGGKQGKLPYYVNGEPRGWPAGQPKDERGQVIRVDGKVEPTAECPNVEQGHELDRAALVSFDEAVEAFKRKPAYAGIGFAFLPGDGMLGVDVDGAIDPETGEMSQLCADVMAMCPSFTEVSVSGTGIHVILSGQVESFKDDAIGLEVYCGRQFFTCSGRTLGEAREVAEADPEALETMREWVEQSKARQQAEKDAARAAKAGPPPASRPAPPGGQAAGRASGKDDFRAVNDAALLHLGAWVTTLLPAARPYRNAEGGDGYRVTSKDLGRSLQEDLAIMPKGINDFGTEEKLTAIDLVMRERSCSARDALHWLAPLVGVTLAPAKRTGPPRSAGNASRPAPPPEGEAPRGEAAGPAAGDDAGQAEGDENGADAHDAEGGGGGGRRRRKADPSRLAELFADYAYQYGSNIAWSLSRRKPFKLDNLKHTFGTAAVGIWLNHAERRVVEEHEVVFEPGKDFEAPYINLYTGLSLKPAETAECQPMLDLLQWLCSTSETVDGQDGKDIADWVLRWIAIQVQRPGTKLQSALVFHGPMGTGKNLLFDVVRDFFGEYGVMVGQSELDDKFNTWLSRRMFIVADEVMSRAEIYHSKNKLKWIITQKTKIPIRAMHMDVRFESNYVNLVFLSNEDQPLALEEGDRRMLVVYTPRKDFNGLYDRVRRFLDHEDGAAKFLKHLLTIPLGDFDEGTEPPLTKAKRDLIELGYLPAERFVSEWLGGYLELPISVCSVEQLYTVYRRWADSVGEKWPGSQAQFTSKVKAFVHKRIDFGEDGKPLDPALDYKVFTCPDPEKGRKSFRCWLPRGCGPKPDMVGTGDMPADEFKAYPTLGHWAASCLEGFEKVARGFMRRHVPEGGDAD